MLKNKIVLSLLVLVVSVIVSSCRDRAEVESLDTHEPSVEEQNPELYISYIETLHNYKNCDHKLPFIFIANGADAQSYRSGYLAGASDRVDFVSLYNPELVHAKLLTEVSVVCEKDAKIISNIDYSVIDKLEEEIRKVSVVIEAPQTEGEDSEQELTEEESLHICHNEQTALQISDSNKLDTNGAKFSNTEAAPVSDANVFNPIGLLWTVPKNLVTYEPEVLRFSFGVHTGIDIGGAVPYPISEVMGSGTVMNVIPKLSFSVGVSPTWYMTDKWSLSAEVTYKTVAMDAKCRMDKMQSFKEINDGVTSTQYFVGRADMQMSFTMLEIPIYVRYSIGNGNNRVLLGAYYSRIFNSVFDTTPVQGMIGDTRDMEDPDNMWKDFKPGDVPVQHFGDKLDNWDAGVIVGYERKITNRLIFGGRMTAGFKDIFRDGEENKYLEYQMWHMRGTLMLSYNILHR